MPDVKTILSIKDLTPDTINANAGTARGRAMVESSVRKYGIGRSILADKHGVIIGGHTTTECVGDVFDNPEVIVVQTTGQQLVVVQRTDLDMTTDLAARELAIADNRSNEAGLSWSAEALNELQSQGVALDTFWTPEELSELFAVLPEEESEAPAIAYTVVVTCQDQAHQREVMAKLKKSGLKCQAKTA